MKMNHRSVSGLRSGRLSFAVAAGAACWLVAGCSNGGLDSLQQLQKAQAANAGNFSNTVFLGDSLTAGYQSGSLLDTQQVHGWAPVVAKQAGFNIWQTAAACRGAT